MSFEDFELFQEELERAQKEADEQEKLKKDEKIDDYGFANVLKERQKHKDALRERLEKQNFNKSEIEKLFKIISDAELKMEEIKKSYNYNAKVPGSAIKLKNDLIEIQLKMKRDFDKEFSEILKRKKQLYQI